VCHVIAEGGVLRWGGSVGFLEGELRDEQGRIAVHATCTVRIVRPRKD
jgi:acyl-coenzyme A thioesterase PaaI-like protein